MTGSLWAGERQRQEKGGSWSITQSAALYGAHLSVWGGEAGAAAHAGLILTACRAINGHNLISHYHHQWLLACMAQRNSIRQLGVWGWGALLKFKVTWEIRESFEMPEQTQLFCLLCSVLLCILQANTEEKTLSAKHWLIGTPINNKNWNNIIRLFYFQVCQVYYVVINMH